jgi:hypothetical protein
LAKAVGSVNSNNNTFTFNFTAKNPGILFTKYTVTVSQRKNSLGKFMPEFNITIRDEKSFVVDNLKGVTKTNYSTMLPLLQYFDVTLVNPSLMPSAVADTSVFTGSVGSVNATLALGEGLISGLTTTVTPSNIFEAISLYYRVNARLELEDDLSYPIYMILDGNYPDSLKKDIIDFIRDARNDVHFMLSRAKYKETIPGTVDITLELDEMNESDVNFLLAYDLPEKGNVTIWAPDIARVKDPEVNGYINVSSIYELAYKIPYNDYNYGI